MVLLLFCVCKLDNELETFKSACSLKSANTERKVFSGEVVERTAGCALLRLHHCHSLFQSLGRDSELGKLPLQRSEEVPQQAHRLSVCAAPPSAHRPAGRVALSVRDGERRLWTGPIPSAKRVCGRAVRGVHRHAQRQGPVLGQFDGERLDHPEDLLVTRPDKGGF